LDETELDTIPQGGQSSAPHPLPEEEDISEGPAAPPHPTAEQIDLLFGVAGACREPKELQGRRLREVMGLSGKARTTKKLLRESMTPALYTVSLSHYEQMLKRQIEEDKPDGTQPTQGAVSTDETPAADKPPAAPPDAEEADRQRLRAEVATWHLRVSAEEIEHVILHNSYARARTLLWKARTATPTATPIEDAAD
jgi:hypothetical protein